MQRAHRPRVVEGNPYGRGAGAGRFPHRPRVVEPFIAVTGAIELLVGLEVPQPARLVVNDPMVGAVIIINTHPAVGAKVTVPALVKDIHQNLARAPADVHRSVGPDRQRIAAECASGPVELAVDSDGGGEIDGAARDDESVISRRHSRGNPVVGLEPIVVCRSRPGPGGLSMSTRNDETNQRAHPDYPPVRTPEGGTEGVPRILGRGLLLAAKHPHTYCPLSPCIRQ